MEKVERACGHLEDFPPPRKPEYLAAKLLRFRSKLCNECSAKREQEKKAGSTFPVDTGTATAPTMPPREAEPKKEKKPKPERPTVTFRCGHTKPAGYFMGQDCGACRNKAKQEKAARKRAERQEPPGPAAPEAKALKRYGTARLPHGSYFETPTYDAAAGTWTTTLVIPREGQGPLRFPGTTSGLWRLLGTLDAQYRKTLSAAEGVEKAEDGTEDEGKGG